MSKVMVVKPVRGEEEEGRPFMAAIGKDMDEAFATLQG